MAAPLLDIRGLTIDLPHLAERRHAVEDVSLFLQPNEILCVVGRLGQDDDGARDHGPPAAAGADERRRDRV
jgi:hypothetical protein